MSEEDTAALSSERTDTSSATAEVGDTSPATGSAIPESTPQADLGATPEIEVSSLTAELDKLKRANRAISGERSEAKQQAQAEREHRERLEQQLAEIQSTLQAQQTTRETTQYQDAGKVHPRLKGRNYDPTDKSVEIDGSWYPEDLVRGAQVAIDLAEEKEQAKAQSEKEADQRRIEEGWEKIGNGLSSDIDTLLTKANPTITEGAKSFASRTLQGEVMRRLQSAGVVVSDPYNPPDGFAQATQKAMAEAYEEFRQMFGSAWAKQEADNETTRQTFPVKPTDAQPGVAPTKTWAQMTDKERREAGLAAEQAMKSKRKR